MHDAMQTHLALCARTGIPYAPTHHLWIHMWMRSATMGNPRYYTTFLDESCNHQVAKICRSCHRSTFERRCFFKYGIAWGGRGSTCAYTILTEES